MHCKFSIVVPIYNSSGIVNTLVDRILAAFEQINEIPEIILVDDCSTDGVWEEMKALAGKHQFLRAIRLGNNCGQWMSTLAGISRASGEYIVTIDDDLEYDPEDILKLISKIKSDDYYLVFGIAPDKYRIKNSNSFSTQMRNWLINFIWQKFLTDSFKIFHRSVVFNSNNEFVPQIHFEAFVNHHLHERYVGYTEVSYHQRFKGSSNHTLWQKISLFVKYSIDYYKFPVIPIGILIALFFSCAMVLEYLIFDGRLNGSLNTVEGYALILISLLILHYNAHIFWASKGMPNYWIVEEIVQQQ